MEILLHIFLVLHICGFASLAGALLADITVQNKVGKQLVIDRSKALTILEGASGIPPVMIIGSLLAILSGIGMMAVLHGAPGEFIWFRIKFPLVVLLILNAIIIARPSGNKLRKLLRQSNSGGLDEIEKVKNKIKIFQITQTIILLMIFVLSAFKF